MREHQHVAGLQVRRDVGGVDRSVRGVGEQHHDDVRLARPRRPCRATRRPAVLGLRARRRARPQADPDVVARVLQVLRVRVALAAEPEHGDLLPVERRPVRCPARSRSSPSVRSRPSRRRASSSRLPHGSTLHAAAVHRRRPRRRRPSRLQHALADAAVAPRERDPSGARELHDAEVLQELAGAPRACRACRWPRS